MLTELDREHTVAALYRAGVTPRIVEVPELTFLMVDGQGDPNTSAGYQQAVQTLFTLSYSLKFAIKRAGGPTVKVAPLEGLWWADDIRAFQTDGDRASWKWIAMIRQPDGVTADLIDQVVEEARKRVGASAVAARLEPFTEGRAAQILHVGPYSAEGPTIRRLHDFIAEQGGHFDPIAQKHHEIYLGDPRRAAPERLRTIIRQPIAAA